MSGRKTLPTKACAPEAGDFTTLWDLAIDAETAPSVLRAFLLYRPDAHPCWHSYMLSLVHLRPIEGKPAHLQHPDSTHEIVVLALDPTKPDPEPDDPTSIWHLVPANLIFQLRGLGDAQALRVFSTFASVLARHRLSPDTDYRSFQKSYLTDLNITERRRQ